MYYSLLNSTIDTGWLPLKLVESTQHNALVCGSIQWIQGSFLPPPLAFQTFKCTHGYSHNDTYHPPSAPLYPLISPSAPTLSPCNQNLFFALPSLRRSTLERVGISKIRVLRSPVALQGGFVAQQTSVLGSFCLQLSGAVYFFKITTNSTTVRCSSSS